MPKLPMMLNIQDDMPTRRQLAAANVDLDWQRVLIYMGADFTADEWCQMSGYDLESVSAVISLAGLQVRRTGARRDR